MLRKLTLNLMALVFVFGVSMTPAIADSHKHDSDHKMSKHDKKDKYKTTRNADVDAKREKREKEHKDHNEHPEKY